MLSYDNIAAFLCGSKQMSDNQAQHCDNNQLHGKPMKSGPKEIMLGYYYNEVGNQGRVKSQIQSNPKSC
jgi:hypothetical protein